MGCQKPVCLKETNPKYHPGIFLGKPFEFEDQWLACHLCMMGSVSSDGSERLPYKREVDGSNPSPTTKPKVLIVGKDGEEMVLREKLIKIIVSPKDFGLIRTGGD